MKLIKYTILAVIYGLLCVFSWQIGKACAVDKEAHDSDLPTITDIQQRVGARPDGKLGKQTEKLWNQAINNQHANQYFDGK